jgi:hypothetical protein
MGVREFLRALADDTALRLRGKCVGDVADGLWSRIGVEDAIADWLLAWAKDPKGEPGAIGDVFAGRTWTGRLGFGKNTAECVFVVITPLSDPQELLRQAYEECHRVLPDGTWSRYGANVEAHRLLRLKYENDPCSWGDVAEIVLDEREPHLRSMGADVFAEAKEIERKRIEKLIARFWNEYGDSFHAELSPDSD